MAGISLEQAEAKLTAYLNAEEAVLNGQTVEMNGQRLSRADLANIQMGVRLWNSRVIRLSGGTIQTLEVIPR